MRRQYHSRLVDGRNYIWDVRRLLGLTKGLPVREVPTSGIRELDETFWFNSVKPTCREVAAHAKLIEETDLTHPIILSADGRVMDGMHRVCKALLQGRPTLSAVQFTETPEPHYIDIDPETLAYT